jgi:hypothetical protein
MYDIPQPEVLDCNRLGAGRDSMAFTDRGDLAQRLTRELEESCAYGKAMWEQLDAVRRYLVDCLPKPAADRAPLGGAAPTGRDDERGWRAWIEIYASVVGTLEGPRRDSGFGRDEARQIARSRLEFSAEQQPTLETVQHP